MPGSDTQPVQIGPFVGGLNNISQSGEAKDNEVVELINYEVGLDTSLISRPPIETVATTFITQPNTWTVLGIYRVTAASWYAIVQKPTGATTFDLLAYPQGDLTGVPTTIKSITGTSNKIVSFVQYNDYCYFNVASGATDTGGRWKTGVAFSAIAAMPRGTAMTVWKDRLWITGSGNAADGNYLWFSAVDSTGSHPETWNTSTDFINISPGLGGMNTALLSLSGYLMVFKEDATFRFSYQSKPSLGLVETVGMFVGCAGPNSVIGFDYYCFVYDQGRVYRLISDKYDQINLNVSFTVAANSPDATAPGVDLSIVNRRLIIRYFNTLYAYSVDTETWSQWQVTAGTPGKFIELPADSSQAVPSTYLAASMGATQLASNNKITDPGFNDTSLTNSRNAGAYSAVASSGGTVVLTHPDAVSKASFNANLTGMNAGLSSGTTAIADYDIPVGPGQQFTFTATGSTTSSAVNIGWLNVYFLRKDGSFTSVSTTIDLANLPSISKTITVPDNAILAMVNIQTHLSMTAGQTLTLSALNFARSSGVASSVGVLKLVEKYQNVTPLEYIECWMKTKSYDYQANSVFKKLLLWGVDMKTNRAVELAAYPLGKNTPVTWSALEAYTWAQLEQGTWANPLSWLTTSKTVIDKNPAQVGISENDRFFEKAGRALRFRQIQFSVKMTTLGNQDTGPCKLFSITTYTAARQLVVDKATG